MKVSMWGLARKDPTLGAHSKLMVQRQPNSRAGLLQRVKTKHLQGASGRKGLPASNHLSTSKPLPFSPLVLATDGCYSSNGLLKEEKPFELYCLLEAPWLKLIFHINKSDTRKEKD